MLIKAMLTGSGDYGKSLKQRRWAAIGMLCIGLVGFACWFFLVPDSHLSEHAQGFYLGAASGISIGAVILLVRVQYLLTHPEARKKAKIQAQDEREKAIIDQAFQFAGMFTFFAAVASMFVLVAVSKAAALAVFGVIVVYAVSWPLASLYLSKKL